MNHVRGANLERVEIFQRLLLFTRIQQYYRVYLPLYIFSKLKHMHW